MATFGQFLLSIIPRGRLLQHRRKQLLHLILCVSAWSVFCLFLLIKDNLSGLKMSERFFFSCWIHQPGNPVTNQAGSVRLSWTLSQSFFLTLSMFIPALLSTFSTIVPQLCGHKYKNDIVKWYQWYDCCAILLYWKMYSKDVFTRKVYQIIIISTVSNHPNHSFRLGYLGEVN